MCNHAIGTHMAAKSVGLSIIFQIIEGCQRIAFLAAIPPSNVNIIVIYSPYVAKLM